MLFATGIGCAASETVAQTTAGVPPTNAESVEIVELPEFVLTEPQVANEVPPQSFAAPVTWLRYDPRVDLQTRNFGEAQGDITVRGGIFEGTAVQVGGLALFDPQTGHYAAELPIPPEMLATPSVATGADHAFTTFNATAGTVRYGWREIQERGSVAAAFGSGSLRRGSIHAAKVVDPAERGRHRIAAEAEVSYSEADGTIANGDHEFFRAAGRVQVGTDRARTEIFAGYQSKFFGWPNLYTPFGVAETEDIQTSLFLVAHRIERDDLEFEAAAHFRRNKDDYEFNRFVPGQFNPFQHETTVRGAFARAAFPAADWRVELRAEVAADDIESTSLTAGEFTSRTYLKAGALVGRRWSAEAAGGAHWETRAGMTFDDTNRENSAWSPIVELAWDRAADAGRPGVRWYAQYSESTRVPGYTALNSPAGGGLFRGNPDLGREQARNLETGLQLRTTAWSLHAALFRRRDDPLVDWTFTAGAPNARSAREVRTDTTGLELVAGRAIGRFEIVAGYTWMEKDADYGDVVVDASFYALNFPRHRVTLAVVARLGGGIELRSDNEYRVQEDNVLRTVGGDRAFLSAFGVFWRPPAIAGLELSVVIDNLWRSDFQELPAVPAPGRQITAGAAWRW